MAPWSIGSPSSKCLPSSPSFWLVRRCCLAARSILNIWTTVALLLMDGDQHCWLPPLAFTASLESKWWLSPQERRNPAQLFRAPCGLPLPCSRSEEHTSEL